MSDARLHTGWVYDPEAVAAVLARQPHPRFNAAAARGVLGSAKGQLALPYQHEREVTGKYLTYPVQTQGTCSARSIEQAANTLACLTRQYGGDNSSETIYAGAMVDYAEQPSRSPGIPVSWAAEFARRWGLARRQRYVLGQAIYDLSRCNDELALKWAASREGVPPELEEVAREHPVQTISEVSGGFEEVCDVLYNRGLVVIGSMWIRLRDRDAQGFTTGLDFHSGHATPIIGADFKSDRPGLLIDYRSWAQPGSGGRRYDQPDATVWITPEQFQAMLRYGRMGSEVIALKDVVGWPQDPIKNLFW